MKPVVEMIRVVEDRTMTSEELMIEKDAPIPTWFGIGGRADRLARPTSAEQLRECVRRAEGKLRVLGDGANLLVDDDGTDGLIVSLSGKTFTGVHQEKASGRVVAGAGTNLPKLITDTVRQGLAGLEGLGGIPATIGGAVIMNAGGAFGQISESVAIVHAIDRDANGVVLGRDEIDFSYRHSGLRDLIITSVEFDLREEDPAALRARLKEVMEYKKGSQPMADQSAGCVWKNPTLTADTADIGAAGDRVSAGMLIDRTGCKGLSVGGASVSPRHANFVVTQIGAKARDVIELMEQTKLRVMEKFGVMLEPEVVVWRRH